MPVVRYLLLSIYLLASPCLAAELTFYAGTENPLNTQAFARLQQALKQLGHQAKYAVVATRRSTQIANTLGDGDLMRVAELKTLFPNLSNNLVRVEAPLIAVEFVEISKIDGPSEPVDSAKVAILKDVYELERRYPSAVIVDGYKTLFDMLKIDRVEKIILPVSSQSAIRQDPHFAANFKLRTIHIQQLYTYLHKKHAHLAVQLASVLQDTHTSAAVEPQLNTADSPANNLQP